MVKGSANALDPSLVWSSPEPRASLCRVQSSPEEGLSFQNLRWTTLRGTSLIPMSRPIEFPGPQGVVDAGLGVRGEV